MDLPIIEERRSGIISSNYVEDSDAFREIQAIKASSRRGRFIFDGVDRNPSGPDTFDYTKRFASLPRETHHDVKFFGSDDEFIVGNSSGHLYILDKNTTNIVRVMPIKVCLNSLAPHPDICSLALLDYHDKLTILSPSDEENQYEEVRELEMNYKSSFRVPEETYSLKEGLEQYKRDVKEFPSIFGRDGLEQ